MMQSHLLLTLLGLVGCGALLVVAQEEDVNDLLTRLENFGEGMGGARSGLTYDQYELLFKGLDKQYERILAKGRPGEGEFLILQDFVIGPMRRRRLAEDDDQHTKQIYVDRMEQAFKLFYPAYVRSLPIGNMRAFEAKHFMHFLNSMEGTNKQEPTLAMWKEAAKEYGSVSDRIAAIPSSENVFRHLEEMELKMNFVNDFDVSYLVRNFSDRLNECKSDADLKPIVAEYRSKLIRG